MDAGNGTNQQRPARCCRALKPACKRFTQALRLPRGGYCRNSQVERSQIPSQPVVACRRGTRPEPYQIGRKISVQRKLPEHHPVRSAGMDSLDPPAFDARIGNGLPDRLDGQQRIPGLDTSDSGVIKDTNSDVPLYDVALRPGMPWPGMPWPDMPQPVRSQVPDFCVAEIQLTHRDIDLPRLTCTKTCTVPGNHDTPTSAIYHFRHH